MADGQAPIRELLSLDAKIDVAKTVARDALSRFQRPAIVWSAGKDSTTALHIAKTVCEENGTALPPCLFLDHGDHFQETFDMLDKLSKEWKLKVIIGSNKDVLDNIDEKGIVKLNKLNDKNQNEAKRAGFTEELFEYSLSSAVGNHLLKTVPMNELISRYRFDALITGIRWDESPARVADRFISRRESPPHFRVQPILCLTERDIWNYIFRFQLPFHTLYEKGYRSIDGKADSKKMGDKPAWEQDVEHTSERAGRDQSKEQIMEKMRRLGYM